jgi:hypothetical protein
LLVPRLFISHSSKDNFEAIAFRDWLEREGWAPEDIFLDLALWERGKIIARNGTKRSS